MSEASGVGTVHLVGAGPGDPGLLTVRARELLEDCDAIVYDALANPMLLPAGPELHFVGKRGGDARSTRQEDIDALLVRLARAGKRVVRLKGGDPLVFGRGSEEALALAAAGIPFEIVPGITAGIAAPAYAGIPVTHRGVATSVTFVTGHEDPDKPETQTDWGALARAGGTIVLYMGVKTLPRIAAALRAGGLPADTPAAAIEWGTCPRQRTVLATLESLAERAAAEGIGAPVITVIGPVAALRREIAWFDRRPLFGRRILVTRATAQAGSLAGALGALGAEVIEMPAIRIEPLDQRPLEDALGAIGAYDWVVITSQNAVQLVWEALRRRGADARVFAGTTIVAVGPATAESLLARGIAADILPERAVAEGILDAVRDRRDLRGARVLYVAAENARPVLPEGLRALGASIDVVPVYRAALDGRGAEATRQRLLDGGIHLATFTSGSAVRAYVEAVGADAAGRAPAASIGPITSEALRAAGIPIAVEAERSTIGGLVDAIASWGGDGA